MGDRAQINFIDEKQRTIYFYTHYDGDRLEKIVKSAMVRGRDRHDDPDYLARVIFCEMIGDRTKDTTGYGISLSSPGERAVVVDCHKQIVTFYDGRQELFSNF